MQVGTIGDLTSKLQEAVHNQNRVPPEMIDFMRDAEERSLEQAEQARLNATREHDRFQLQFNFQKEQSEERRRHRDETFKAAEEHRRLVLQQVSRPCLRVCCPQVFDAVGVLHQRQRLQ